MDFSDHSSPILKRRSEDNTDEIARRDRRRPCRSPARGLAEACLPGRPPGEFFGFRGGRVWPSGRSQRGCSEKSRFLPPKRSLRTRWRAEGEGNHSVHPGKADARTEAPAYVPGIRTIPRAPNSQCDVTHSNGDQQKDDHVQENDSVQDFSRGFEQITESKFVLPCIYDEQ